MTRADRVLILALAALALAAWPLVASAEPVGRRVVVGGPLGETALPLGEDVSLEVAGRVGVLTVVVRDGQVAVAKAECPDHVCVKTGPVASGGSVIACVPNGVIVLVEGGDSNGLDARIR